MLDWGDLQRVTPGKHRPSHSHGWADIEYADGYSVYDKVCVADNIKITVSQANDDDSVDVVVVYYAGA